MEIMLKKSDRFDEIIAAEKDKEAAQANGEEEEGEEGEEGEEDEGEEEA